MPSKNRSSKFVNEIIDRQIFDKIKTCENIEYLDDIMVKYTIYDDYYIDNPNPLQWIICIKYKYDYTNKNNFDIPTDYNFDISTDNILTDNKIDYIYIEYTNELPNKSKKLIYKTCYVYRNNNMSISKKNNCIIEINGIIFSVVTTKYLQETEDELIKAEYECPIFK